MWATRVIKCRFAVTCSCENNECYSVGTDSFQLVKSNDNSKLLCDDTLVRAGEQCSRGNDVYRRYLQNSRFNCLPVTYWIPAVATANIEQVVRERCVLRV